MRLLTKIEDDIRRLETQRDNLHNLLEQGIYDAATYRDRKQKLVSELSTLAHQKERLMKDIDREIAAERTPQKTIPHVIHVLDLYPNMKTPAEQNRLLRTVLYKAVYNKEKHQRGAEFDLDLYPLF